MLRFSLILLILLESLMANSQMVSTRIQINQVGFYPFAPKIAIITGEVTNDHFYITSTNLRDTVYEGKLGAEKQSAYSSTKTRSADFSKLNQIGSFVVLIPGVGHSYVFEISPDVHRKLGIASLKGYYYQRASMPLPEQFAGKWHRSAGHPDTEVLIHPSAATKERPAGSIISSPGGWYDAGDYNKYIVNSGITMGTLLSAYEDFSTYYQKQSVNIPESKNAIPDILDEVIYNLRWMLTMQDPYDGGVYNKCTNANFDGMVMPGITKAPRYVVQKGTAATLDFAAVTAQASRILKKFNAQLPGLADSCLKASKKAWDWSLKNPALEYNQNKINAEFKPEIMTGGYGDKKFTDEWLWASTELWITTQSNQYFSYLEKHLEEGSSLPNWANVGMLANYSLLRMNEHLPATAAPILSVVKNKLLQMADTYLEKMAANAFGTVMGQSAADYNWGGNANAANQGILLLRAFLLTKQTKYADGALTNLDYILGRNATGFSFVTGIGSKTPMHPHHRPSVADGITEPVPGLLSGGPNKGRQDRCVYEFTETETAFTDHDCSYASNEIAINWNAPLVYLANAIEALKDQAGYIKSKK